MPNMDGVCYASETIKWQISVKSVIRSGALCTF